MNQKTFKINAIEYKPVLLLRDPKLILLHLIMDLNDVHSSNSMKRYCILAIVMSLSQ